MAANSLFERGMAAMQRHQPALYELLRKIDAPSAKVVGTPGHGLNLDLGHTQLYAPDADRFLDEQWAKYSANPDRLSLHPPPRSDLNMGRVSDRAMARIYDYMRDHKIGEVSLQPRDRAAYMLIFGVGLGLHIERLFDSYDVHNIVIIEQFPEFIWHSLHYIDWERILDGIVDGRKGTIRFMLGDDPQAIGQGIYWHMRARDFGLIDGAYIYRHYTSFTLDKIHETFIEQLPVLMASKGFFEDEIKMMTNCFENFARAQFDLLEVRPRQEKSAPAFIVGSGPSIDRSFDTLRRLRDQAVIFSCGTTLSVLLRNDVWPHFHCEMENVPAVFEHLEPLSKQFDLKKLTLIASNTVDPRVPALFGRTIIYFRENLSPTHLWGDKRTALYGAAPNVSNLGTRVAATFSFMDIYFFGVDLGSRRKDQHHAKDAVYNKDWAKTYTRSIEKMNFELPGNFGGKAHTNRVLLWARMMMQRILIAFPNRRFYNCSDGVRIEGALPKMPHTLKFDLPTDAAETAVAQIFHELTPCQPRDLLKADPIIAARAAFAEWREEMKALTERLRGGGMTFNEFYEAARALISRPDPTTTLDLLESIVIGTMMMIVQFAHFFAHRLPDDYQSPFLMVFADAWDEAVDYQVDEVTKLFDSFLARLDDAAPAA